MKISVHFNLSGKDGALAPQKETMVSVFTFVLCCSHQALAQGLIVMSRTQSGGKILPETQGAEGFLKFYFYYGRRTAVTHTVGS